MNDSKPGVKERIDAVRTRYVDALAGTQQALAQHWNRIHHLGWDGEQARRLQWIAHRLAGTGKMFGFPEISRAAVELDSLMTPILVAGLPPAEDVFVLLGRHVDDLLRVLATTDGVPVVAGDDAEPDPGQGGDALLVLIDDDEFLRARLSALLEGAGYRVQAFADPASALSLLREQSPAAVLLDLMLPGRRWPAFDVIAEIRSETGERTPVILISARPDFASRLEATRAGADDFLTRPLDDRELLAAVERLALRRPDEPWRCLVVEDDEAQAAQVVVWLQEKGLVAESVQSPRESWLRVREFKPDVVLLDINMPECNGIELATMMRQDPATTRLPIVFMTADASDRTRRAAVAAGADDFLLKPLSQEAVVQSVVARARLARPASAQVTRVTRQDSRCGGLSRHYFFTELEDALDAADDGDVQPALVLLTLLETADVVHRQGAIGAAALSQQFSERLSATDLSNWSMIGEGLIGVLLARDTASGQQALLARAMAQIEGEPYDVDGVSVPGKIRAVLLHLGHQGDVAARVALSQAEQMLHLVLAGKSGIVSEGYLGRADPAVVAIGRLPVTRLRTVFQPIVTIDGAGVPLNAVLVRLADRDGNLLPAGKFLAQMEARGWLPELDAWVFARVHKALVEKLPPAAPMVLVVTASVNSLSNAIYVETVLAHLAAQPMRSARQCLVLALPESAGITHRGVVEKLNEALQAAGCGLMFTGYGGSGESIAILEHFHPLFVRLDPAVSHRFEQVAAFSPSDRLLMDAANSVNVGVVAGGVESPRTLSALWSKGVRRFQGYFLQEPAAEIAGAEQQVAASRQ